VFFKYKSFVSIFLLKNKLFQYIKDKSNIIYYWKFTKIFYINSIFIKINFIDLELIKLDTLLLY